MSAANSRALWIIGGQEFDDAEPILLMLPVRLEIVFVLRCQDRQITFFQSFGSRLAVQERYNESSFFSVLSCSLQGVALRPLPCNYNVIQSVSALSRRRRGFKSRRGHQETKNIPSCGPSLDSHRFLGSKVGSNWKCFFSPKRGLSCARSTKVLTAHNPTIAG